MNPPASASEPPRLADATPASADLTLTDLLSASPMADELDHWLDSSPAQFLSMTSAIAGVQPTVFDQLAADTTLRSRRPLRALAVAGPVLQRRMPIEPLGIDLPRWLLDLDCTTVTATMWRPIACDEDWLIEATLPGGRTLTARLIVTCITGAVEESAVVDATASGVQRNLTPRIDEGEPFLDTDPIVAATSLIDALGRHGVSFGEDDPGSRWPGEEALVTWLVALLVRQTEPQERLA